MADLIPFGKHRGKPVDALLDDRQYMDWLLAQGWFKEKYGNIYQIVINNGQEPSETPEHNAMQIKFLELDYRLKFAVASHGVNLLHGCSNRWLREQIAPFASDSHLKWAAAASTTLDGRYRLDQDKTMLLATPPAFEVDGTDVVFGIYAGIEPVISQGSWFWPSGEASKLPILHYKRAFVVEIKPIVGDDYPAVLRQVKRNKSNHVLIKEYTGIGASKAQFIQFFHSQSVTVIFENQIDMVEIPPYDTTIDLEGRG